MKGKLPFGSFVAVGLSNHTEKCPHLRDLWAYTLMNKMVNMKVIL